MSMHEENIPPTPPSSGEPPIQVPSVEGSWSLMRQRLDATMPVHQHVGHFRHLRQFRHLLKAKSLIWATTGLVGFGAVLTVFVVMKRPTHPSSTISHSPANLHSTSSDSLLTLSPTAHSSERPVPSSPDSLRTANSKAPASLRTGNNKALSNGSTASNGSSTPNGSQNSNKSTASNKSMISGRVVSSTHSHPPSTQDRQASVAQNRRSSTQNHRSSTHDRLASTQDRQPSAQDVSSTQRVTSAAGSVSSTARIPSTSPADLHSSNTRVWTQQSIRLTPTNANRHWLSPADDLLASTNGRIRNNKSTLTNTKTQASLAGKKGSLGRPGSGMSLSAGLSIEKSIPLGQQQASSYNASGKNNSLSDYLPAPFFRWQVNNRLYFETVGHLSSPQYVRKQRIDSTGGDSSHIPGWQSYSQYNTLTLSKLFYTDLSLTANFRVVDNLWLGAGIRYAKLRGGSAEQTVTMHPLNTVPPIGDTVYSSNVIALKNNAAYDKLSRSEWRGVFSINYLWRRFTLGVQYEKAFNIYLPSNGVSTSEKNTSLRFHLNYDLWRNHKK